MSTEQHVYTDQSLQQNSTKNQIMEWAFRLLPFLSWTHRINRGTLRHDLIAGLTGAIVVLPQGVAFATIAGAQEARHKLKIMLTLFVFKQ